MTEVKAEQASEAAAADLAAMDEQIQQLADRARAEGLRLTGEGGLLGRLTKLVTEAALVGEIDDHLGYGKHDPVGRGGNSRNGTRAKTVLTEAGPVEISVPRDRDGSFEPTIVKKRQRRLTGVDDLVISLSAKGLTHGEISAHLVEIYGAEVSKQTISTITDRVMDGMAEWQNRPLDPVYPVIFIDCIHVKIREGQVANRPIYVALAVTVDGTRDVHGLWAGEHGAGEGAKYWLRVLSEIKNRGTVDCCIVVCDGLKGLPEAIAQVWPQTIVQTCIVHLLRHSFRYASRKDWSAIAKDLKPVYTAPSEQAALDRFAEFSEKWEARYPAIVRLWTNAWAEFVPFLQFDTGDSHDHLHDQRHREHQRAHPPRGERSRPLPQRAGCLEVRLSRNHES
ncbi:transposase-like protein [Saccharopolyspora spinosa]|uniref:Mutator family transposase n=1 Tax=Saccharopolyspora spinosa TaxID=60894 RepID=A0A2N3Y1N1_SACSN|nr:transposase-like protein [Saccharopolyspora spinosa]